MSDEYIWLLKGDNAYKNYKAKNWNTIISVRVESGDIYYCLTNNKQFINEDEKIQLLAPICIINQDYQDCVIIIKDVDDLNFIWKKNRCFKVSDDVVDVFEDTSVNYLNGNVINVVSASELVSESSIVVKSSSIVPVIILTTCFIVLVTAGLYVWLL